MAHNAGENEIEELYRFRRRKSLPEPSNDMYHSQYKYCLQKIHWKREGVIDLS